MSDGNFVKRNLKRKSTFQYKKFKPLNNSGGLKGPPNSSSNSNRNGRFEKKEHSEPDSKGTFGLGSWGVDATSLSLDWISKHPECLKISKQSSTNRPSNHIQSQKIIRGLHINQGEDANSLLTHQLPVELMEKHSPCCTGHQMPARLFQVKKAGPNKGKYFYSCTFPYDQKCSFFLWAEDNPALFNFFTSQSKELDFVTFAIQQYQQKLYHFTRDQLVNEIKKLNKRMIYCNSNIFSYQTFSVSPRKKLLISGSKEDLLSRLIDEARWFLTQHVQFEGEKMSENVDTIVNNSDHSEDDDSSLLIIDDDEDESSLEIIDDKKKPEKEEDKDDEEDFICFSESDDDNSLSPPPSSKKKIPTQEINSQQSNITSLIPNDMLLDSKTLLAKSSWYFGYNHLKEGQDWAIKRVLEGKNSLAIMPTGYGKSFCYILPALVMKGLTIVVSPLISLMRDQLLKLPIEIPGFTFTKGLTTKQSLEICQSILCQQIKILFVSPERLCSNSFRLLMRLLQQQYQLMHNQPTSSPISLLCVDEAHCLSQWSYNFRPSFLRIRKEINTLRPHAILALTATASAVVTQDIATHLHINPIDGILRLPTTKENFVLEVHSMEDDEDKRQAILQCLGLITSSKPTHATSSTPILPLTTLSPSSGDGLTIIYVNRRRDAEALSTFLAGYEVRAAVYHGGMETDKRESVQRQFDRGNAHVIVATSAFGMGIDNDNVRQVIHYSMPKSLSSYLQEIGRAGRNLNPQDTKGLSRALLLYSPYEVTGLYAWTYSQDVTALQVLAVLLRLFPFESPSFTAKSASTEQGFRRIHNVILQEIEETCDVPGSLVETILTLLELPPFQMVEIDRNHYDSLTGKFRLSGKDLEAKLAKEPILNTIFELANASIQANKKLSNPSKVHRVPGWDDEESEEENDVSDPSTNQSEEPDDQQSEENLPYGGYKSFFSDPLNRSFDQSTSSSLTNQRGYNLNKFIISKTELANKLQFSYDKLCAILYTFQHSGYLEYTLTNSSLAYYPLINIPVTSQEYLTWIMNVTETLMTLLTKSSQDNHEAVLDMYRVSLTMQSNPAISSAEKYNFVIQCIESECHLTENKAENINDTKKKNPESQLQQFFQENHKNLPFHTFQKSSSSSSTVTSTSEYHHFLHIVQFLSKDKQILQCLDKLIQPYPILSSGLNLEQRQQLAKSRSQYVIHSLLRILLGLPSRWFLASIFSSGIYSEYWGRYREYHVHELHSLISQTLFQKDKI